MVDTRRMDTLFDLAPAWPEGFRFEREVISPETEAALVAGFQQLPFRNVVMRGVASKRRIVQFGHYYSFQTRGLTPAAPIPHDVIALRERVAPLSGLPAEEFTEALVTEYSPGAAIGWHRDAPPFGVIVGVSFAGTCTMKLKPRDDVRAEPMAIELPPRSAYVFSGVVRRDWLHHIPPAKALRYSVTFRTIARR